MNTRAQDFKNTEDGVERKLLHNVPHYCNQTS